MAMYPIVYDILLITNIWYRSYPTCIKDKLAFPVGSILKAEECSTQVGYWVYFENLREGKLYATADEIRILKEVKWMEIKQ
jgi:hypothetical protein